MPVSEPNRFPDSVFDRIGSYLPAEHRPSYYRYVAHLRTLGSNDELMMLAEGMGLLALITRQVAGGCQHGAGEVSHRTRKVVWQT